tara:strand:- start:497 stop:1564 length:1068 start_codon:yes stop_codon:yes gene_type:complete
MTARASAKSVKLIMMELVWANAACGPSDRPLNILTFATHERYEENLCKTGHNFYSLRSGKEWDTTYAPVPKNYHIVNQIPEHVDIDIVLSHTSCNRLQLAHDLLSGTAGQSNKSPVPILRHCHILPDVRGDVVQQAIDYRKIPVDANSFISGFNRDTWGFSADNSSVVEHGIDTEFWNQGWGADNTSRESYCLSVVNEFPSRDWCCGFSLWKEVASSPIAPFRVVGKCTGEHAGFSQPAQSREELRDIYQTAAVFLNTSLHSPVPTVMMEAMACGCPVVTTGTCMIPEIIEHGVNGIIADDASDMKFWCRELLAKPELARKIGEAGRKTIEEKYSLEKFVQSWNKLFYKTIGEFK